MNVARALNVDEARAAIHAAIHPLAGTDSEILRLTGALGRVLAADIVSPVDVPGCDNSAMDGWALKAADTNVTGAVASLKEVGSALAGLPYAGALAQGECVRIMTGAAIPEGADAVVMQEAARCQADEGGRVEVPANQPPGQNIRRAGEDLQRGALALAAGTRLHAAHLGLIASLGLDAVRVFRRLRVAVFSTGSELRSPGQALARGDIYDSNRHTLLGLLARIGCDTEDLGIIPDEPDQLEAALRRAAAGADAVITSGGVSAGDHDFTRALLSRLGEVNFWHIAMRPGRPMAFGRLQAGGNPCLMFALPGNPVATAVAFVLFVRGALLRMMGSAEPEPLVLRARSRHGMAKKAGRTEYQRGIIQRDPAGGVSVGLTGPQGSALLTSLCQADCLIVLRHDQGNVAEGDWVDVLPLEGLL
jgi:molybdopterin molybdotransferase